jgi:hypothetical protein
MLISQTFEQHVSIRSTRPNFIEINRLLAAAVVSRKFCALLLSDPAQAIAQGFSGERFNLSVEEYNLVLSVRGSSLQEFSRQLCESMPRRAAVTPNALMNNYTDCYRSMV